MKRRACNRSALVDDRSRSLFRHFTQSLECIWANPLMVGTVGPCVTTECHKELLSEAHTSTQDAPAFTKGQREGHAQGMCVLLETQSACSSTAAL